jgi:hypothetical protein
MKTTDSALALSEKLLWTVAEFCAAVGIGRTTFYKAVTGGDIKVCKYGKRTFVRQDEAKRFVANMAPG